MRVLISEPIRKVAIDFTILRSIPGFAKNPIKAIKEFLIDSFKKGEFTLQDALGIVNKNVKTAGITKNIIVAALILFGVVEGSRAVGTFIKDNFEKSEMLAPELSHQEDVKKIIQEK